MIDCIIPAAGASQRMGRWKPALRWGSGWVIDAVVQTALAAGTRVILVTRTDQRELLAERFAAQRAVILIDNPHAEVGMFSSIQCGVRRLGTRRFFVLPADMPLVPAAIFTQLRELPMCDAVRPTYRGQPGHPVLLSARVADRVLALPSDATMRRALDGFRMRTIETTAHGVCIDLDTPGDYHRSLDNGADSG
ncbi:MAG: hypothetical protein EA384_13840 [Spirochaetaceae bacterium]|nr:MAG: hypothetical protein EA384_13840 [Spirochaetaceae bacterium]